MNLKKFLISVFILFFNSINSEIKTIEFGNFDDADLMKIEMMNEIIDVWRAYLKDINWQDLIRDVKPRETGCGLVYELGHPIDRANEDFAIVDMRNLKWSEPHYHSETEIYFIMQGSGLVVIGDQEKLVKQNDIVVVPSNIAHFVIPEKDLVLGVVCHPPFDPAHYIALTQENKSVQFDKNQFDSYILCS